MGEVKARSIRADEDVFIRFKALSEDFPSQADALAGLVELWETQGAKAAYPDRAVEISDFEAHIKGLQAAYLRSLEITADTTERVRGEMRAEMEVKERTIATLHDRISHAVAALDSARASVTDLERKLTTETVARQAAERAAAAAEAALVDKQALIDGLTQRAAAAEGADQRIAAAEEAARAARAEAEAAKAQAADLQRRIETVRAEAELAAARAETERDRAVLEAERTAHEEVRRLTERNAELFSRLTELRAAQKN